MKKKMMSIVASISILLCALAFYVSRIPHVEPVVLDTTLSQFGLVIDPKAVMVEYGEDNNGSAIISPIFSLDAVFSTNNDSDVDEITYQTDDAVFIQILRPNNIQVNSKTWRSENNVSILMQDQIDIFPFTTNLRAVKTLDHTLVFDNKKASENYGIQIPISVTDNIWHFDEIEIELNIRYDDSTTETKSCVIKTTDEVISVNAK